MDNAIFANIDQNELDFVVQEATPELLMQVSIQLNVVDISFLNTVSILYKFGVNRCRSTVHDWVQRAGLQPLNGVNPNHVAVDVTVIQLNNERF